MSTNRPTRTARALRPAARVVDEDAPRRFEILVMTGPDMGRAYPVDKATVRVGSDPENDVALTDETVSRYHFVLEETPRGHRVRDLGSTNGTKVDGVTVVEAYITPGAQVVLGETTLRFQKTRVG